MKKLVKITTFSLFLVFFTKSAMAIQYTMPSYMLDHTGFKLPENSPMANAINLPENLYPAVPLVKKRGIARNKVIGYSVPAEYLYYDNYRGVTDQRKVSEAMQQMHAIGLHTLYHKGVVYGTREKYDGITAVKSEGFGLSISLDFSNTLDVGDYTNDYTFDPLAIVTSIFEDVNDLFSSKSFEHGVAQSLREANILSGHIYNNARNDFLSTVFLPPEYLHVKQGIEAIYSYDLKLPSYEERNSLNIHTHAKFRDLKEEYSSDLNSLMKKIKKKRTLSKEAKWREEIARASDSTLILKDPTANLMMQTICDVLAEILEVPREIWPKCHVAATLVPNAWAYPGGDIFISAGMIGITKSLDSIIYVLGHEIGHVVARHVSKKMPYVKGYQYGIMGVNYFLSYVLMSVGFGDMGSLNFWNFFPKTMYGTVKGTVASFPMNYIAGHAIRASLVPFMMYGRSMESESDRIGQELAISLGLDNQEFINGWKSMRAYSKKYFDDGKNRSFWDKLLSSHPSVKSRIDDLEDYEGKYRSRFGGLDLGIFPQGFYDDYKELHKLLNPFSIAYGKYMKAKIEKRNANQLTSKESLMVDNFMESIYSGALSCIFSDND